MTPRGASGAGPRRPPVVVLLVGSVGIVLVALPLVGLVQRAAWGSLAHDLRDVPKTPEASLRRGRRSDKADALVVDHRAFPTFWRLDAGGLHEAMTATPSARFRVAVVGRRVAGYAVTGRAGHRGYLQRLAVDPTVQGRGLGRALVADSLEWLRRRGVTNVVVNTQVENERALRLYQAMGFRLQPSGLEVLGRTIAEHQPAR